jgi:hypothetical protein
MLVRARQALPLEISERFAGRGLVRRADRLHDPVSVSGVPRLPRDLEAIVPTDKLVQYVLNPDHARGCHKARVFLSALGIRQADWRYLRDQLMGAVVEAPVRGTRITSFGVLYDVVVLVDGLNGSTRSQRCGS